MFSAILVLPIMLSFGIAAYAKEEYRGIDVSEWQKEIDWQVVKDSGINFAMIRSGYGKNDPDQKDKYFDMNIKNAQATGINTGIYHYSYAKSPQAAIEEAEFCLEIIKGYKFEYPIAFDIEEPKLTNQGKRALTDIVKAFCDRISQAGYYTAVYCNPNWLKNHLYQDELFPKYDLWLANWKVDAPSYDCGMWQHTSKGSVPGIVGNVDLDISYKDYPSIMKSQHLNGY